MACNVLCKGYKISVTHSFEIFKYFIDCLYGLFMRSSLLLNYIFFKASYMCTVIYGIRICAL